MNHSKMRVLLLAITFSDLILFAAAQMVESVHPAAHIHRGLNEDYLECTVHRLESFSLPGRQERSPRRLSCIAEKHGPTVALKDDHNDFFSSEVISGVTTLKIPTQLVSDSLKVDLDDPLAAKKITILDNEHKTSLRGTKRSLSLFGERLGTMNSQQESLKDDYDGTFRMLVIRVSDKEGHSPTHSSKEISEHVFTGDITMASQYSACSNGKLQFDQANGSDVVDGVFEVTVDTDLSLAWDSEACVNAADDFIRSNNPKLGIYDYTMYICPDVVDFGSAVGVANVNGNKSWYLDTYGSMPFVQMHEIGHNLFFYHSSEGGAEYGDPTCVMGGIFVESPDWGKMCFNAAKTFTTGWYSDHHSDVSPKESPYNGNLVDVNSANQGKINNQDDVVVRVRTPNDFDNLYFMLHRLEGITGDMFPGTTPTNYIQKHANKVNIVSQFYSKGTSSVAVAQLASGEEYIKTNWAKSGKDLHIKVCSISDSGAKVITYLEGHTFTSCDDGPTRLPPTSSPTKSPTPAKVTSNPTKAPTPSSPHGGCADSTLKMFIRGGAKKSCSWVATNNTQLRCEIPGVASHCPVTCGTCILCTDSAKRFQLKTASKDIKSCSWVRNAKTKFRCTMEGVASACRETCGTCTSK